MIIVKLGGSVITEKSRYKTFRKWETMAIIEKLSTIKDNMIIVHGGGSFGHIKAKEFGIPGEINSFTTKGFSVVHKDMVELNQLVTNALLDFNFNPISIAPSSIIYDDQKNYKIFPKYLLKGLTPVGFGDVYLRDDEHYGIFSGDTIVHDLSISLKPNKVIFIADVDGLYNKNPKLHKDAKLLTTPKGELTFQNNVVDVTGGIESKYKIMREIREAGTEVYLLNGLKPERILDIGTENFIGTVMA